MFGTESMPVPASVPEMFKPMTPFSVATPASDNGMDALMFFVSKPLQSSDINSFIVDASTAYLNLLVEFERLNILFL